MRKAAKIAISLPDKLLRAAERKRKATAKPAASSSAERWKPCSKRIAT